MINIALPKGRLGKKVYQILENIGYGCPEILEDNRKLVFEDEKNGVRYFWVKPSDVGIYVERGAADVGVVGKDIILEHNPDVYEFIDMGIGKCKVCVAGKKNERINPEKTLRIATKFENIAKDYYRKKGREIEIIKLNGSIELAPILNLSDVIVDIVETGTTLKENNLEVKEEIVDISARFIINKSSYKFKNEQIVNMADKIKKSIEENKK